MHYGASVLRIYAKRQTKNFKLSMKASPLENRKDYGLFGGKGRGIGKSAE